MKKFISLICIFAIIGACLCACSKIPEEPASSTVVNFTVVDRAETAASTETASTETASTEAQTDKDGSPAETTTAAATKEIKALASNFDVVIADYYTYNKSYAKIKDVVITDYGFGKPTAYALVELSGIAFGEDELRIGYRCYDADGETVRSSYLLVPLKAKDLKEGDTFKCRFDMPLETDSIEFVEYAGVADIWSEE